MSTEPVAGTITWSRGNRSETLPYNASGAEMHAAIIRVLTPEDPAPEGPDHGTVPVR